MRYYMRERRRQARRRRRRRRGTEGAQSNSQSLRSNSLSIKLSKVQPQSIFPKRKKKPCKSSEQSYLTVLQTMASPMHNEPSINADKLGYEIFSVLESNFLFKHLAHLSPPPPTTSPASPAQTSAGTGAGKNSLGKVCILTIDGGGMRGILPGKALAYLEQSLKAKSGDPEARISDYFDVVAGTGFGGIFAAMLFSGDGARRRFAADETWKLLAEQGRRLYPGKGGIFRRSAGSGRKAATAAMEEAMKAMFPPAMTLKDAVKPVLIPCYDMASSAPLLFSRADALTSDGYDFRLWEVCRATAAAPAVFSPAAILSVDGRTRCLAVDGGLAMSNPAAAAITHVLHNKLEFPHVRGVEDLLVLSLGAGQLTEQRWPAKDWSRPAARIAADASAESVDHAVAMAFGHSRSSNYVRIQANGSSSGRWRSNTESDSSSSNVKMLVGVAEEMLKQKNVESVMFGGKTIGEKTNAEKLDWFAGELVLEHQRRSCRIAPTVSFKQAVHRVP